MTPPPRRQNVLGIALLPPRRRQFSMFFLIEVAADGPDRIYLFSNDRETLKQNSGNRIGKKKGHTTGLIQLRARPLPSSVKFVIKGLKHLTTNFINLAKLILVHDVDSTHGSHHIHVPTRKLSAPRRY
ncbi:hypothetical protein EVAR_44766_1 [Eumeta japonica]|uniref:Uncharacterized protein n=1 Tax=Eumeta variegata TaxID=151549 RepID=A0A4C1Y7E8_EUMVA|nr:hypothetical protein EVAR_44766_1 [Eumeta japonica]